MVLYWLFKGVMNRELSLQHYLFWRLPPPYRWIWKKIRIFVFGSLLKHSWKSEEILRETAKVFSVSIQQLSNTARLFVKEWKGRGEEVERLKKELEERLRMF